MLDHEQAKKILNNCECVYTDEQIELIQRFLWQMAQLTVEAYFEIKEKTMYEDSNNTSKSEL